MGRLDPQTLPLLDTLEGLRSGVRWKEVTSLGACLPRSASPPAVGAVFLQPGTVDAHSGPSPKVNCSKQWTRLVSQNRSFLLVNSSNRR